MKPIHRIRSRRAARTGFTLTEIMIACMLALVVVGAALSVLLAVTKSARKAEFLAAALQNTREVQEHIKREIGYAMKKHSAADDMGLTFEVGNGSGRYARLVYRIPVSNPLRVAADAAKEESKLILTTPAGVTIEPGDYVVMSVPKTGNRLRVTSVTDPGGSVERSVTVQFSMTIEAATEGDTKDVVAEDNNYVSVCRERKYETADPGTAAVTELTWWENSSDSSSAHVLSTQVAADGRYMFAPDPNDLDLAEDEQADQHAVHWYFVYQGSDSASGFLPGTEEFWNRSQSEGVFWARSGDPENPTGNTSDEAGTTSTTTSTTSTSTTSTSTTSTSKTTTTSTKKSTTTKTTTTSIKTTSTSKTTTTSIKTTSKATTSTSSIKTTTTSKQPTSVNQDG